MIKVSQKGNFKKTRNFLKAAKELDSYKILEEYALKGVKLLAQNTPIDTGNTAMSWYYEIERKGGDWAIYWKNSNVNQGYSVAILLQYGHGTGTGGYVQGRDYLNPVLDAVFAEMAGEIWRKVESL